MGYTVHIHVEGEADRAVLDAWAHATSSELSETAESIVFRDFEGAIWAPVKPGLDEMDMMMDVDTLVAAAQQLQARVPGARVRVTDDFDSELFG